MGMVQCKTWLLWVSHACFIAHDFLFIGHCLTTMRCDVKPHFYRPLVMKMFPFPFTTTDWQEIMVTEQVKQAWRIGARSILVRQTSAFGYARWSIARAIWPTIGATKAMCSFVCKAN